MKPSNFLTQLIISIILLIIPFSFCNSQSAMLLHWTSNVCCPNEDYSEGEGIFETIQLFPGELISVPSEMPEDFAIIFYNNVTLPQGCQDPFNQFREIFIVGSGKNHAIEPSISLETCEGSNQDEMERILRQKKAGSIQRITLIMDPKTDRPGTLESNEQQFYELKESLDYGGKKKGIKDFDPNLISKAAELFKKEEQPQKSSKDVIVYDSKNATINTNTQIQYAALDYSKVLDNLPSYKDAHSQIEELTLSFQKDMEYRVQNFQAFYEKLQEESNQLSSNQLQQKQDEILTLEKELRQIEEDRFGENGLVNKFKAEIMEPIESNLKTQINEYVSFRGIRFLFDISNSNFLLYLDESTDVTEDFIIYLNQK